MEHSTSYRLKGEDLSAFVGQQVEVTGTTGDEGAVYGHPGGGPLKVAPARIGEEIVAVGTNIYRTSTSRRHVFVLAAALAPGIRAGAPGNRAEQPYHARHAAG